MQIQDRHYKSGKLIISGAVIELSRRYGKESDKPSLPLEETSEDKRNRSVARARKNLRRKINANAGQWYDKARKRFYKPLFLTLTFKENLTDIMAANKKFHRFVMRFNYNIFNSRKSVLKYATVIEFQKRGAVHYHSLLFNVPFIADLGGRIGKIWGNGFIKMNSIDGVDNVGAYVVKYMTKEGDDPRLKGKKSYFCSKYLIAPLVITDEMRIMEYMEFVRGEPKEISFPGLDYRMYKDNQSLLRFLPIQDQFRGIKPEDLPERLAKQLEMFKDIPKP